MSANHFTGEISTELQYLVNLAVPNLSVNELTGLIPPSLIPCAYLNFIDLHDNKLTGSISLQLGLLTRLDAFDVLKNTLSGMIPTSLVNRRKVLSHFNASSFLGNEHEFSQGSATQALSRATPTSSSTSFPHKRIYLQEAKGGPYPTSKLSTFMHQSPCDKKYCNLDLSLQLISSFAVSHLFKGSPCR